LNQFEEKLTDNKQLMFTGFPVRHRDATLHQNKKNNLQLIEKVLVSRFIFICPLWILPVQLEERAITQAIPTFYTHNPLKDRYVRTRSLCESTNHWNG
jgi:hypothetical protein